MSSSALQAHLGQTLVDFSSEGIFPEEDAISSAIVEDSALPAALIALSNAKAELETEIREISRESAPDVDSWIANAQSLQDDIETSRRLAVDIVQQAKAEETREETIREKAIYQDFLTKEASFNAALLEALRLIQTVHNCLDTAEQMIGERRILDALDMLEDALKYLAEVPAEKNTRAIRLLDQRALELKGAAHEHLMALWDHLIAVDIHRKEITINATLPAEPETLEDAIAGLKYYKELDSAAAKFSQALDKAVISPRTDVCLRALPSIKITKNRIGLGKESVEPSIKSLFHDLEAIIRFLNVNLPNEFLVPLSEALMPDLSARIKELWLDTAVPSSLDAMRDYQKALAQVHDFALVLKELQWPGVDSFNEWVSNVPKIWLGKKREEALDWVRNSLSFGIGMPQEVKRVETRTVEREDIPADSEWDSAWAVDEDEPSASKTVDDTKVEVGNKHDIEEELRMSTFRTKADDDTADAWGWGEDDDDVEEKDEKENDLPAQRSESPQPMIPRTAPKMMEKTIFETYWTSSLPQPILKTIDAIFNDGATLLKPENEKLPVAPAAAALFVLPTLILAMYRSVGPIYYAYHASGNMFLYNDTLWLAERLSDFVIAWKSREDLPPRATALVRLDSEIETLISFGKRAYTNELNAQRNVINDLLGGAQNFFQDESSDLVELKIRITNVIDHIHSKANDWERILSESAWSSSLGALVNAVATRMINDVFDMSTMNVTEAENTATIITMVEKLDDLFIPKQKNGRSSSLPNATEQFPLTAQFADKWIKMKYLSQVLQSNLVEIDYLWKDSELSLFFTAQEVIDLIELSFEDNPKVRSQIREIKGMPHPMIKE